MNRKWVLTRHQFCRFLDCELYRLQKSRNKFCLFLSHLDYCILLYQLLWVRQMLLTQTQVCFRLLATQQVDLLLIISSAVTEALRFKDAVWLPQLCSSPNGKSQRNPSSLLLCQMNQSYIQTLYNILLDYILTKSS